MRFNRVDVYKAAMREYIQNLEKEDKRPEQLKLVQFERFMYLNPQALPEVADSGPKEFGRCHGAVAQQGFEFMAET